MTSKLREAALAYQLEKKWSKEKILNEYLNIIYFGQGAYGVEAAALTYFGVHAADLTLAQAALLAGLPEAPSAYSPRRNPEAALARRDLVLNKMYQQNYITSDELQQALSAPLQLGRTRTTDSRGEGPLLGRDGAGAAGGPLRFVDRAGRRTEGLHERRPGPAARPPKTSIAGILDKPGDPSAALVSIDVRTGRMVAMVGGADFATSQFNLATQGKRQPGSAFKPFVLVTALEAGPQSRDHLRVRSDHDRSAGRALGSVLHRRGASHPGPGHRSNPRTACTPGSSWTWGRMPWPRPPYDMGIITSLGEHPNPAIALGGLTTGVSPLEMAMAYATLATGGERLSSQVTLRPSRRRATRSPSSRVTDSDGNVLDQNSAVRTRVVDPGLAAIATSCLQQVITSGTGTAANIGRPAAGKTGTTQNYCDAWFVGYTPELVTAVWVGYPAEQQTHDRRPRHQSHGRLIPRADLGIVHEEGSRRHPGVRSSPLHPSATGSRWRYAASPISCLRSTAPPWSPDSSVRVNSLQSHAPSMSHKRCRYLMSSVVPKLRQKRL